MRVLLARACEAPAAGLYPPTTLHLCLKNTHHIAHDFIIVYSILHKKVVSMGVHSQLINAERKERKTYAHIGIPHPALESFSTPHSESLYFLA